MEEENGDEIPFSAKSCDGSSNQATPDSSVEQNSIERTGDATKSAGNERPEFELETHTKNDLIRRSAANDQDGAKAKSQAEAKNAADAELDGFTLTGSVADNLRAGTMLHKAKSPQS